MSAVCALHPIANQGADTRRDLFSVALKPGDAVVGTAPMKGSAAFAPGLHTPRDLLVKKPDNLSFAKAACLPVAGVTAWLVRVKHAGLTRGQKLFINGATGAVGHAAIAIAREIGAEVTGRVGRNPSPRRSRWG